MAPTCAIQSSRRGNAAHAPLQQKQAPKAAPGEATAVDTTFVGMTGGEIFHEMMLRQNVKVVFGYPGGAILPVYDAIYNSKHFDFVLPRHEQGGGHMAQGYARACGKPGVLLVTSGPGATNTITPMQDALMDGTPLVVFTGQVATGAIGTDAFQEADTIGISRSCTKWNAMVIDIADMPRKINQAFEIATTGRPGPVLVDLPKDVTAGVLKKPITGGINAALPGRRPPAGTSSTEPSPVVMETIRRAAKMINNAKKPLLYVGQGVLSHPDGPKLLRELAHRGNIPVTTTLQGLGAFDELDPLSLLMLGMHGSAYANLAMQTSDCIIALGARFDDRVTGNLRKFAPAAKKAARDGKGGIIHFEIMPKNIDKVVEATEAVEGDVVTNMRHLIPQIQIGKDRAAWLGQLNTWKSKYPFSYRAPVNGGALKPQRVIEELDIQTRDIKDKVIITTGVGQHQMWAAQYYRWRSPRTFITSGGLGTMGFGLPSAIGAKVAHPDKIVIDIDGDASFSMTGMELMTARQFDIPVKALILNNDFQGMVKQWQDLFYDQRYSGTKMRNPDFVKFAESMGCVGLRVRTEEELPRVMAEFLACKEPVLLDAMVEKNEHVLPMVPAGKALHEMELGDIVLEETNVIPSWSEPIYRR
ncbi:acetolactate synthase [Synchytrium microbalum]|uniref:Acetolactate synthase n=1 Tax=Synchytrium microbalum TaxID=1806994 RepID=A0A507CEU1_9FUNG|nr:acetolactate synthase [Synchytrium microbalum]TPX38142.1 acetolactate synthase [Synchytrium microbalum]